MASTSDLQTAIKVMDFYNDIERFGDREALLLENNESISYSALIRDADAIRGCVRERCLLLNTFLSTFRL
ncbi:MAG: hypothetical protein JRN15_07720, partial [Nitrososphaerota archaeon]|nr:hypothetical protein [Nitrososphaerota archaeon]